MTSVCPGKRVLQVTYSETLLVEPGILRFGDRTFRCINSEREEIKRFTYSYDQVTRITIRARHQHMDLQLVSSLGEWSVLTNLWPVSETQQIVSAVALRSCKGL